MMLLLAVLFVSYNIALLIKGNFFALMIHKRILLQLNILQNKTSNSELEAQSVTMAMITLLLIILDIAQFIFVVLALRIDPSKIPTIILLLVIFLQMFFTKYDTSKNIKNNDTIKVKIDKLNALLHKVKRYSVQHFVNVVINIVYYTYIITILI